MTALPTPEAGRPRGVRRTRKRPPAFIWVPSALVAVMMLLPLAYLVLRSLEGGLAGTLEVLTDADTFATLGRSVLLAALVTGVSVLISVPPRLADRPHGPPRKAYLGGVGGAAARDSFLRRRLRAGQRTRTPGRAAGGLGTTRRRAAVEHLRPPRREPGAHPVLLPVHLPDGAGRLPGHGPGPRRSRQEPRQRPLDDVFPGNAAAAPAGDRGWGFVGRALHVERLRGGVAAAIRLVRPGDLHPVPVGVRPDPGRGAGPDAGDPDGHDTRARRPDPRQAPLPPEQRGRGPPGNPPSRSGAGSGRRSFSAGAWSLWRSSPPSAS